LRYTAVPVLCALALIGSACSEPERIQADWQVFGRPAGVELYTVATHEADELLAAMQESMRRGEQLFALDRADGGLVRLNEGAEVGYYAVEDQDLYRSLLLALDYARASRGAFDPTVGALTRLYGDRDRGPRLPRPGEVAIAASLVGWNRVTVAEEARSVRFRSPGMRLDLGGLACGFTLDIAARNFARPGTSAGLLTLGHSSYAWAHPPGSERWRVAVPDPRRAGTTLLYLHVATRGISVSGHPGAEDIAASGTVRAPLIDPRSGKPAASGLLAAVAVADTGADADAVSTALFVLGISKAGELLSETRRVEAVLLAAGSDGPELLVSGSLQGRLELTAELENEVADRVRYVLPPLSIRE